MARGDGAWSTASVHWDEWLGTITHPSRLTITQYRPGTVNSCAKLRRQPLRLESYWKRGEKYPSRMNPLSLWLLRGSTNPGSASTQIPRNFFIVLLQQRQWMKLLKSHVHLAQYIDGVCTSMRYLQTMCSVDLVIVLFRVDNTCHRSCDLVTRHTLCCI